MGRNRYGRFDTARGGVLGSSVPTRYFKFATLGCHTSRVTRTHLT